jgi:hypothetical protein
MIFWESEFSGTYQVELTCTVSYGYWLARLHKLLRHNWDHGMAMLPVAP